MGWVARWRRWGMGTCDRLSYENGDRWMRSGLQEKVRTLLARFGLEVRRLPKRMLEAPDCRLHPSFEHVLAYHLQSKADPSDVFFVQIGAFDGISGDPLHAHVTRYGWRGILVEPQPRYFEALQHTYAGYEELELVQAAIAEASGEAELYTLENPDAPDLPDWAPQIASFDLDSILRHRRAIPHLERRLRRETVRCITMDEVLEKARSRCDELDLVQIDVEGYDHRLIELMDLERFSPVMVRFEHKLLSPSKQDAAVRRLADHGYQILREAGDTLAYRPLEPGSDLETSPRRVVPGSRDT